jgi:hypothetical protein
MLLVGYRSWDGWGARVEIREYLYLIRRRLWIPILLPLFAGGAAYSIVSQEPQQYEASVIVTIPSPIAESDSFLTVYSDNFKEVISSEAILDPLSRETGISTAALDSGIVAVRLQRSILIEVSFTAGDRLQAARVVVDASRQTLDRLAKPKVAAAQATVKLAQSRYDRARSSVYRFYRTTGLVVPVEVYTTKLAELSQLERTYQEALQRPDPNDGNAGSRDQTTSTDDGSAQATVPDGEGVPGVAPGEHRPRTNVQVAIQLASQREAAAILTKITRIEQELARLRPQVLRYRELDADVTGSLSLLTAAQKDLLDASSLAAASSSPLTLGKAVVTPVSRPQLIARGVGIAMGLAFVLALGLLAVLELLWPSRGSGRHAKLNGQSAAINLPEEAQIVDARSNTGLS